MPLATTGAVGAAGLRVSAMPARLVTPDARIASTTGGILAHKPVRFSNLIVPPDRGGMM